ncbi:unnamed protein product [Brachionus calyciflorus]|uniref:Uncharacterized protein n=1 Tax=Brachionus calyciflorus TaxID=104777 RepID=A0A814FW80_9BILA|nr:unnamed protein product [Brachionus calyciflorus]
MKFKTQEIKKSILKNLKLIQQEVEEQAKNPIPKDSEQEESDDDEQSLDSDQELQLAFARKQLTPGLNIELPATKEFVYDKERLERKYKDLYLNMEWPERLDITVPKSECQVVLPETEKSGLVDNDFKRESFFLKQAELSVRLGLPKLENFGIKTKRPEDYFAEMAKSDEHMKKVRENLLSKHAEQERREKVRKLRELKKMGKQIQIENEKKKLDAKKKLKDAVKKYKKGDKDSLEIEIEEEDEKLGKRKLNDELDGHKKAKREKRDETDAKGLKKKGKKQEYKDKKYGFGGRKKRSKYNTADSYAEAYKTPVNNKKGGKSGGKSGGFRKNASKKFANKNKPKSKR